MSLRFRYRSSPRFESLDLAGAGAVSVRDLRARILGPALRRHFDLLISDAASNRLLDDDTLLISAGSDLVVKRVAIASDVGGGGGESSNPHKTAEEQHGCGRSDRGEGIASLLSPLDKFDDPCNMLCPGLEAELSESCADDVELEESSNKRCSEMSCRRYLNIKRSVLSEAMPKEIVVDNSTEELDLEEGKRKIKTNYMARECEKMEQNVAKPSPVIPNMDVPAELRCFLCKTIFEDAVMIPCCQHSFCNKYVLHVSATANTCQIQGNGDNWSDLFLLDICHIE